MLATIYPAPWHANDAIAKYGHGQAHVIILYFTTKIAVYSAKLLFSYGDCKVAGSNLTWRDDWISRWRLHSIGPTSMGLSSLGQNIIRSPVARVVYG